MPPAAHPRQSGPSRQGPLPAGTPNAINAFLCSLLSISHFSFFTSLCALRGTGWWAQPTSRTRHVLSYGGCEARFVGRLRGASLAPLDPDATETSRATPSAPRIVQFVQQFRSKNTPRARNSLFLRGQGVARVSGVVRARNSVTIRATRSIGRGTPLGFMIYDR